MRSDMLAAVDVQLGAVHVGGSLRAEEVDRLGDLVRRAQLAQAPGPVILVANEVGLGIVPENALARRFRDHAGRLHQTLAARADHVALLVAGLPIAVKGAA